MAQHEAPAREHVVLSQTSSDAAFARSPRSLLRILNIFETLSQSADGCTLTEFSRALGSPKSSLLALLRPLVAAKYLATEGSRYRLGSAIVRLSLNVLAGRPYASLVRGFLEELAERSGESVYLTALDRDSRVVTYVDVIESRHAVRYAAGVGAVRPLYVSAAGRVLLAYQDAEWTERYLQSAPFRGPVTGDVISADDLRADMDRIRHAGFAVSLGEAVDGAAGIATPLFDSSNWPTHALLIAAPKGRMIKSLPAQEALIVDVGRRASDAMRHARG
jgi:DNA-binding IclR family transcriptional regulator